MTMARAMSACKFLPLIVAVLLLRQPFLSSADFLLGGQATVLLPPSPYQPRFAARAVVLGAQGSNPQPGFVAAVSVKARAGRHYYACSLVVLLGGVKVWASDHLRKFVPAALCRLELAVDGQLQLTDGAGKIGWFSGTAGQGVKALHLNLKTGNLVLVDAHNRTKWQSSNEPTDTFVRGQNHTLPAYLITSKTKESSPFYSFELDGDKIAAYIHLGETSYSYWELAPTANRTMASARLDGSGLKMLDREGATVAQVTPPVKKPPLSFMALGGDGNVEMFYYDAQHQKFRVSYKALGFCELPLSCGLREACSAAGKCEDFSAYADTRPGRGGNSSGVVCDGTGAGACMVHLRGVTTVLRTTASSSPPPPPHTGVTLRQCVLLCARNLSCNAALYDVKDNGSSLATADDHGVCSHYTLTAGAREVSGASRRRYSYWVRLHEAAAGRGGGGEDADGGDRSHSFLSKVLMICGAIDVVCAVVFAVLIALYFRRLRRLAAVAAANMAVELQQGGEAEGGGGQGGEHNNDHNDGTVQN